MDFEKISALLNKLDHISIPDLWEVTDTIKKFDELKKDNLQRKENVTQEQKERHERNERDFQIQLEKITKSLEKKDQDYTKWKEKKEEEQLKDFEIIKQHFWDLEQEGEKWKEAHLLEIQKKWESMTKDNEKWKKKMVDVFENNEKSQNEWKETVFENLQKAITDNEKTNEKWKKSLNDTIDQKLDKVINAHDKAIDSFWVSLQSISNNVAYLDEKQKDLIKKTDILGKEIDERISKDEQYIHIHAEHIDTLNKEQEDIIRTINTLQKNIDTYTEKNNKTIHVLKKRQIILLVCIIILIGIIIRLYFPTIKEFILESPLFTNESSQWD